MYKFSTCHVSGKFFSFRSASAVARMNTVSQQLMLSQVFLFDRILPTDMMITENQGMVLALLLIFLSDRIVGEREGMVLVLLILAATLFFYFRMNHNKCYPRIQWHFNEQSFYESLRENKSLKNCGLDFEYCNDITGEGISNIITSLASRPELEELHIYTFNQFGELSSKALQKLLSKTQTLSTLEFFNVDWEGGLNIECIIQGLKKNQSLDSLSTENSLSGDLKLSRFFQILPHCPNLEYLKLREEDITKDDFEQVIHMDRLQKPIVLEIHDEFILGKAAVMTKLLRRHPKVRLKVVEIFGLISDGNVEFEHICELNWNGRYLIDDSTTSVPLSLWPLVFERVNDKPSIIYEFLKDHALYPIFKDWSFCGKK